jgi:hypothetical protein
MGKRIFKAQVRSTCVVFLIRCGQIVAASWEIPWYWWPVTILTNLKNQRHASGHVIQEVAVEEPNT